MRCPASSLLNKCLLYLPPVWGTPISSLPTVRLRQLSTPAHAYALLHLPPAAQSNAAAATRSAPLIRRYHAVASLPVANSGKMRAINQMRSPRPVGARDDMRYTTAVRQTDKQEFEKAAVISRLCYEIQASSLASALIWAVLSSFRALRMRTEFWAKVIFLLPSSIFVITLAAMGAQEPFSTKATVRFW